MNPSTSLTCSPPPRAESPNGIDDADHDQDCKHEHEHEHEQHRDHVDDPAPRTAGASSHQADETICPLMNLDTANTAESSSDSDRRWTVVDLRDAPPEQSAAVSVSNKLYAALGVIGGVALLGAGYYLATRMGQSSASSTASSLIPVGNGSAMSAQGFGQLSTRLDSTSSAVNATRIELARYAKVSGPLTDLAAKTGAFKPLFNAMTGQDKVNVNSLPSLTIAQATELSNRLSEIPWERNQFALPVRFSGLSDAQVKAEATRLVESARNFILKGKGYAPGLLSKIDSARKIVSEHKELYPTSFGPSQAVIDKVNQKRRQDLANTKAELARLELLKPAFDEYVTGVNRLRGVFKAFDDKMFVGPDDARWDVTFR